MHLHIITFSVISAAIGIVEFSRHGLASRSQTGVKENLAYKYSAEGRCLQLSVEMRKPSIRNLRAV